MTPPPEPEEQIDVEAVRPGDVIVGPWGRYELEITEVIGEQLRGRYTKVPPNGYAVGSVAVYLRSDWKDGTALLVRRYPGLAGRGGED